MVLTVGTDIAAELECRASIVLEDHDDDNDNDMIPQAQMLLDRCEALGVADPGSPIAKSRYAIDVGGIEEFVAASLAIIASMAWDNHVYYDVDGAWGRRYRAAQRALGQMVDGT